MDDSTSADLIDPSPIGSPDRVRITVEQLWKTSQPHNDAGSEDSGNVAVDFNDRQGSPQRLPRQSRGSQRLKPLPLDTNLSPPFLLSPGYPSAVGGTPSPTSYTSDYFEIRGDSLLQPAKVYDDMGFHHYSPISIYDPVDFDEGYAWDFHSSFSTFWNAGDESDASEPSDDSDYITFTDQSSSIPPELELGFRQLDLSEPGPFILDFPEDVGESLEHDVVLVDCDSGMHVIDRLGRPTPVPASGIPVGISVQPHDNSQTLSACTSNIPVPRIRKFSEDNGELELVSRLPYPELDVMGIPINVPVSPCVIDGFPDDTISLHSDLVSSEVGGISMDVDWLGGSLGEMICSPCLEEGFMEWDRWRGQLFEELNRDLDSWAEVRESVRAKLDRY